MKRMKATEENILQKIEHYKHQKKTTIYTVDNIDLF